MTIIPNIWTFNSKVCIDIFIKLTQKKYISQSLMFSIFLNWFLLSYTFTIDYLADYFDSIET